MSEPIVHTLDFTQARNHYIAVEARFPTDGRAEIEAMMAVWTPGSYLVREYARHVEDLRAETPDGAALPVVKSTKNRWRVTTGGSPEVVLRYLLYCRELSVRTNFVDSSFAILNGAPTFLTLADDLDRPHHIHLRRPAGWKRSVSPLPPLPGAEGDAYLAVDFDTLVDSPLYLGNGEVFSFEVAGKEHVLVNEGGGEIWDGPRSAADTETVVRQAIDTWGEAPYERYVFFNLIAEAGGGLEHKSSTVLLTSRWKARDPETYLDWLGLVSHEFFHTWNVKRLRPVELGPFDYEREVHSQSLWIAEGITSYYDDLLLRRAELSTDQQYLKRLSRSIERLQTTPGRQVQSLAQSSYDAWIKLYRPDENSSNSGVSYYTKGAVVAFLLDAHIRSATGGAQSLDPVLRAAYRHYSGARGFTPDEFRAIAEEVTGLELSAWFKRAVETTEELDYQEALANYGLRFKARKDEGPEDNGEDASRPSPWIGVETSVQNGLLVVTGVRRGGPGHAAGLNVGDEIVALGGYRVPPAGWAERLKAFSPGERVDLLVARREELLTLPVELAAEPEETWKLEIDPEATEEQTEQRQAWLTGRR
jgi:predicted metalloprotease with PDZ domain